MTRYTFNVQTGVSSGVSVYLGFTQYASTVFSIGTHANLVARQVHILIVDFSRKILLSWASPPALCSFSSRGALRFSQVASGPSFRSAFSLSLVARKQKTGFTQTDHVIDRIIRFTVQTGVLQAICAILNLVLFVGIPNDGTHFIFNFILSKLFTNSLLSSLNSRASWTTKDPSAQLSSNSNKGSSSTSYQLRPRARTSHFGNKSQQDATVEVYLQEHVDLHVSPLDDLSMNRGLDMKTDLDLDAGVVDLDPAHRV
ncbi:hypothetical protein HGRIS_005365 [Hohenbuehelia grisea]|uniref:DUF6534 domain-containing protein n=1 Tax=Hohenbuehelia grisea TaxID=104357 RepID=A0ABR3JEZ7_9AGAR